MTAPTKQQIQKQANIDAVHAYLKTSGSGTPAEIHAALPDLNVNLATLNEYLRALTATAIIHRRELEQDGLRGAMPFYYAYGPAPVKDTWTAAHKSGSCCKWLGANEWKRGQHGRDALQAAMFGEVRP